ncbi:patched family protein [Cooperia oncophora]
MIRMDHMTEALEILELVSSHFPMYNADLGRNQSFKEFCKEFCQANEPVKMFYNGLRVLKENVTDELRHRINFSYPTSEIFGVKFSLLILELVSSHFPMYNADLGRNQSFKEFCKEFCQANEPVKMFYNGLRVLKENVTDELRHRINFSYPTSEIFGVKFSLLPNFFGVEVKENGELKSATVIAQYEAQLVEVNVVSMSIVENAMLQAAVTLRPFLVIGFTIMCIFCTTTTLTSSVMMYHHKATINKVILSVAACVVPFMACGTAIGTMLIIGVRFAPILHITTFLVLAVSVDDSFLMIHAWNRLAKGNNEKTHDRANIMSQVLVETGPAIVISSCTNAFAFAIGAVSSPPDIRIFCIGNACAILVDMLYQFTLYTAMMTLFADFPKNSGDKEEHPKVKERAQRLLRRYTELVADFSFSIIIVLFWALFVAGAIVGLTYSTVDLSAHKVFKRDSKLLKIDRLRNEYMTPSYTFATVVVSNPGNFSDPENVQGLFEMKNAFESLPHAIGPESTKFVLSEYLNYKEAIQEEMGEDPSIASLDEFLNWPEYSYYNGFIKRRGNTS